MSEIISPPFGAPGLRLTQTQKDLVGGSIGGIAQVLVGQPFDIVKVRIQTSPSGTYASPLDCAKQLLKADGPRGFYKVLLIILRGGADRQGTLTPLLGIGPSFDWERPGIDQQVHVSLYSLVVWKLPSDSSRHVKMELSLDWGNYGHQEHSQVLSIQS